MPDAEPIVVDPEVKNIACRDSVGGSITLNVSGETTYINGSGYTFFYSDVLPGAHYSFEETTDDFVGSNHLVSINPGGSESYLSVVPEKIN